MRPFELLAEWWPPCRRRAVLFVLAVAVAFEIAAAPPCTSFDVDGMRPGMSLVEVRRVMQGREDTLEVSALTRGFETTATFHRDGRRTEAVFPDKVTPRSKTGLSAVRLCVSSGDRPAADFASLVRSQFGEPTSGGSDLDEGLRGGAAVWTRPDCLVAVRAFREAEWWDPSADELCVEVKVEEPEAESSAPIVVSEPTAGAVDVADRAPDTPQTKPLPEATVSATPGKEPKPARERRPPERAVPIPELEIASAPAPTPTPAAIELEKAEERALEIPRHDVEAPRPPDAEPTRPIDAEPAGLIETAVASSTAPRLIASTPAQYPPLLRDRRITARVTVRATILPDGSVGDVVVAENNRPGYGFENRVIAAVRKWRYEPARQGTTPVTAEILIPFVFE